METEFLKVSEELGVVFGWAIVCKVDGEPYFDLQGDHIPEDAMLKAATDFALNSRVAGEMHTREITTGTIPYIFPLTEELCTSLGIVSKVSGLLIGMKPNDESVLNKFKTGQYTGFSIGGSYVTNEDAGE